MSSMGSPTRDPYHNRSMEPRLSRDPPRESFNLMVVGEAGLGKTTLLESFFKSFKARRSAQPCLLCTAPARTGVGQGPLARATRDPSLSLPPRSHETPHVASLAPCRPRRVPLSPRASAAPTHPAPPACSVAQDDDATFALFERKETHSVIETRRQIEEASARRTVCERDVRV